MISSSAEVASASGPLMIIFRFYCVISVTYWKIIRWSQFNIHSTHYFEWTENNYFSLWCSHMVARTHYCSGTTQHMHFEWFSFFFIILLCLLHQFRNISKVFTVWASTAQFWAWVFLLYSKSRISIKKKVSFIKVYFPVKRENTKKK